MSSASVGICEVNCMLNLGKCISNDLLLCIHTRHNKTDSNLRIEFVFEDPFRKLKLIEMCGCALRHYFRPSPSRAPPGAAPP